jgi:hypothetical protein
MKYFYILIVSFFICSCTTSTDKNVKINTNHTVKFSYNLGKLSVEKKAPCLVDTDYISIHDRIFDAMSDKEKKSIIKQTTDVESDVELVIQCPTKDIKKLVSFSSASFG